MKDEKRDSKNWQKKNVRFNSVTSYRKEYAAPHQLSEAGYFIHTQFVTTAAVTVM
jgi:hypothetical protein